MPRRPAAAAGNGSRSGTLARTPRRSAPAGRSAGRRNARRTAAASIVADVMISFRSRRADSRRLDVAQQEIDVQRPLVGFVDDQRVVLIQEAVLLRFGQQDAVGHQLDVGLGARRVGEADFEADGAAQRQAAVRRPAARRSRGRRFAAAACARSGRPRRGPVAGRSSAAGSTCPTPSRRTRS